MSDEPILHHYPNSPFSEKLRLLFGLKGLAWRSVIVPVVMPKPDVVALTGGYRRTPLLQVGADVYCDTALAARVLQARAPEPELYPAAAPLAPMLAAWADATLFWICVAVAMQPAGRARLLAGVPPEQLQAFAADRASFTAGLRRPTVADATAALRSALAAFEAQLQRTPWIAGERLSIADFSVYHGLWFVRFAGLDEPLFAPHPALRAWLGRVAAFGHGRAVPMTGREALAVAAGAAGHAPVAVAPGSGFEAGDAVTVTPLDYGCDPVAGRLVGLDDASVTLRRQDERAGIVHVHFPRAGFQILKEKQS